MRIKAKLGGLGEVRERMQVLESGLQKKLLRRAVVAGNKLLVKGMRRRVPVRYGVLKKSLGSKVKVYRSGKVLGIVGPRTGMKQQVGTHKDGSPIYEDPAKIAHLVEQGHGGPHPAPAYPFARPALDEDGPAVVDVMRQTILAGMDEVLRGP